MIYENTLPPGVGRSAWPSAPKPPALPPVSGAPPPRPGPRPSRPPCARPPRRSGAAERPPSSWPDARAPAPWPRTALAASLTARLDLSFSASRLGRGRERCTVQASITACMVQAPNAGQRAKTYRCSMRIARSYSMVLEPPLVLYALNLIKVSILRLLAPITWASPAAGHRSFETTPLTPCRGGGREGRDLSRHRFAF